MPQDYTTMRVPTEAHEAAQESKREGETWGEFIQRCTDTPPELREFVDAESVSDESGLTYDDVLQACRAAIREELPVDKMGR